MARDTGSQSHYAGAHGGIPPPRQWYPEDEDMILSKKMSQVLRHTAAGLGLEVLKGGFVRVRDLLEVDRGRYFFGYTEADIIRVVRNNNKQRFTMGEDDRADLTVRANQGHTGRTGAAVDDEALLTEVTSVQELERRGEVCVHGTYWSCWESIRVEGLKPMGRNHVHFAIRPSETGEVVSGMRANCELLIFLDVGKALADGLKLYRSSNDVLLSRGFDGIIPTDFFQRVVQRWQNKQIWPPLAQAPAPKPLGERRVPGLPPALAAQGGRPGEQRRADGGGQRRAAAEVPGPPSPVAEVPEDWEDVLGGGGEAESPSSTASASAHAGRQRVTEEAERHSSTPSASTHAGRHRDTEEASRKVCKAEPAEAERPGRRLAPGRAPEPSNQPAASTGAQQREERRLAPGQTQESINQPAAPTGAEQCQVRRRWTGAEAGNAETQSSLEQGKQETLKKELRGLEKKLRQITLVEEKRSGGKELNPEEEEKVSRKAEIESRIQKMRGMLEDAGG